MILFKGACQGQLRKISCFALIILSGWLAPAAWGQMADTNVIPTETPGRVILPPTIPDPIEPVNRVIWDFNVGLMRAVIKPTSKAYRFVVRKPVRTAIGNVGTNLNYPDRLFNNLLEAKWGGARNETYRFLCNTTVGVVGIFDVADKWKIPRSDADFGQTFGYWGWKPECFLMLPLLGPSNERDALGFAADTASNPLLYVSPYEIVASDPLSYLGPYTYFTYLFMYNNLSDSVDGYVRFSKSEMDPYSEVQYEWTYARNYRTPDWGIKGPQDQASLETVGSAFFSFKDPEFPDRGSTSSAFIPSTKRKLKFSYWLQPGTAPVVYIVPGLGSHRLAAAALGLAELLYNNGFSVVTVSSAFHAEFMENASTTDLPAYLPVDGHDMHVALTQIDRRLHEKYPKRLGERALMGYSMGGLQTLYIAATAATNQIPLLQFDRYLALDTPVRMEYGMAKLDEYYNAPLKWPVAGRTDQLQNTILKVTAMSKGPISAQTTLPFNAIESKFLIGLTFRMILRDVIFSTQQRHDQGVLRHPIENFRRYPLYQEILQYSYQDYFQKFAIPYYQHKNLAVPVKDTLKTAGDLRNYNAGMTNNPAIRVIVNQNDFLLADEDLNWLHATFTPEQLTVFPNGGHLGNFGDPKVQKAIVSAMDGLGATPPKPK